MHCGAGDQHQPQGHVGGERISDCCVSASMRGEVALESTASRSPTPVRTSRRWPARILHDLRRQRQAQGHPETPGEQKQIGLRSHPETSEKRKQTAL